MKEREAPEFTIHAHVAGKLSDIQGFFLCKQYIPSLCCLSRDNWAQYQNSQRHTLHLTTTQNFIFVREAMQTNNNFSITGIRSLPNKPCIFTRPICPLCLNGQSRPAVLCYNEYLPVDPEGIKGSVYLTATISQRRIGIICLSNNDRASFTDAF